MRLTARDRRADRWVDAEHARAARQPDPIGFLRQRWMDAEQAYAETGDPDLLALVRAFERSLGNTTVPLGVTYK